MAWLNKGRGRYYYRSVRHGDKVTSEYIGNDLDAHLLALDLEQRQAEQEAFRRVVEAEEAIDREVRAAGSLVRNMLTLAMVATGHRQHKRQWRVDTMAESHAVTLQRPAEWDLSVAELNELIAAVNTKRPTKKQRSEFMRALTAWPKLAKHLGDANAAVTVRLIESTYGADSSGAIAAGVNMDNLRQEMGYDGASVVEKMLIDHILIAWLRLQQAEWRNLNATLGEHTHTTGEYWDKRLSAAQGRYLRAVETLARVRRLNVTLQVNIAQQQIVA